MAETVKIALSGATGRMGRTVAALASADVELELVGGLDREGAEAPSVLPQLAALSGSDPILRAADVLVDFSAPEFLGQLLDRKADALAGVALVIGTTGLGDEQHRLLDRAAERSPVLTAANFSAGVNLLLSLVETATRSLGPEYDIEIVETHHKRKEDAPSGTALALGEAAATGRGVALSDVRADGRSGRPGKRPGGEIGFHALRGGDVIGEHEVHWIGELERVVISHRASDRALFAAGALRAAKWLAGREPGRYTMRQVLGL